MDVAGIKAKNYADAAQGNKPGAGSGAEQLLSNFSAAVAERMRKAGMFAAENGSKHGAGLVGQMKPNADIQVEAQPEARADAPSDNVQDASSSRRDENRAERRRTEGSDTHHDDGVDARPAHAEAPRETQQAERADAAKDGAGAQSHGEDRAKGQDDATDTKQQAGHAGDTVKTGGAENAALVQVNVTQVAAVHSHAPEDKTITVAQAATEKGANAQAKADAGAKKQNASGGQAHAGEGAHVNQSADGDDAAGRASDASSKTKGQAQTQTQANPNTHLKADASQGADKGATVVQQQAQDLSKKVGSDKPLSVTVTVANPSEALVSKPAGALIDPAALQAGEDGSAPTTGKGAAKTQAINPAAANAQGAKDPQVMTPQTDALQALQAQKTQVQVQAKADGAGLDAKVQATQAAGNVAQAVKAGGAEAAAPAQPANTTANTQQAQAAKQPQPAQAHLAKEQVTDQVKVQITKAINDGVDKIRIQLKPAHLGRVDVQLEMTHDGRVSAVVSADNKDTLNLLKQDARELERALREAGLNLNSGDLSFNLRGEGGRQSASNEDARPTMSKPIKEPTLEELLTTQPMRRDVISEDRVDITA